MKCYFDGSVGGQSEEWLTLAGFAASDAIWAEFQKQWQTMLRERYPVAPYVHMTDLITGNGEFATGAGWLECKVNRLVFDIENLFASFPPTDLCGFACAIDVHAHRRLVAEEYKIGNPSVICAEVGLKSLLGWHTKNHALETVQLFYDQGEAFIRSIRGRWLESTANKKLVTDDLLWRRIANVQPLSMKNTPGLQAADVVAWAFTRRLRNEPDDQWAGLATKLLGDRDNPGILTNTQLDPITEQVMRSKYSKVINL